MNKWATLKEDMYGYSFISGKYTSPILIPQGTIVDLSDFISSALCGDVTIAYNPDERDELFEELK